MANPTFTLVALALAAGLTIATLLQRQIHARLGEENQALRAQAALRDELQRGKRAFDPEPTHAGFVIDGELTPGTVAVARDGGSAPKRVRRHRHCGTRIHRARRPGLPGDRPGVGADVRAGGSWQSQVRSRFGPGGHRVCPATPGPVSREPRRGHLPAVGGGQIPNPTYVRPV